MAEFTSEQIAVRERVWKAAQKGEAVLLTGFEVRDLWQSILQTGIELVELRERRDVSAERRDAATFYQGKAFDRAYSPTVD